MNFREAEAYLLSLGNEVETMKLGLDNIRKLLAAFGDPQNNYLKVQVAGTNGKGSVCAFLRSICLEAGINAGVFTSPHLTSITERINIGGADIAQDDFARFATKVRETSEKLFARGEIDGIPTFFEQVTAIALLAFAEAKVALAILETGLGGRLDATTAANAEIAAITRIDYDHQQYLGDTLSEIAAEKAAIIHQGSKVIVGEQHSEALRAIHERCSDLDIAPLLTERNCQHFEPPPLALVGRHQIENAKVANLVAKTLEEYFPITAKNIDDGLKHASHPGRLEFHGRYLFDGAHNVAGARALRDYLDEHGLARVTMIFGAVAGKEVSKIAEILFHKAHLLILTQPSNSRALTAERIAELVPANWLPDRVWLSDNVAEAVEIAKQDSDGGLILVTGSLYLVGEVKKILNN